MTYLDPMPKASASVLPPQFLDWFKARDWTPRDHQVELLTKAQAGRSVLLVAPTGAGKTLAGFLPSLVELAGRGTAGPKRRPKARPAHSLHLAPEGARDRHRAQPRDAGPRDGPADPGRDPHGRHALAQADAADRATAGHPADHARAARPAARASRGAGVLRGPAAGRARRAACPRHLEARRSPVPRPGAVAHAGPRGDHRRAVGHGARAGRPAALPRAAARGPGGSLASGRPRRGPGWCEARHPHARHRSACRWRATRPTGPCRRSTTSSASTR